MGTLQRALLGGICALLLGMAPTAHAAAAKRVSLTRIVDRTGRISRRRTLRLIERALRAEKGLRVVGRRALFTTARRLRIKRRRMWRNRSLRRIARRLRLELVIEARVERHGGAYRLLLEARQVTAKGDPESIAEGSARQRRSRFSWRTVRRAARGLMRSLRRHKPKVPAWADAPLPPEASPSPATQKTAQKTPEPASPEPPDSPGEEPASMPATDDGWNIDSTGFSAVKPEEERASLQVKQGGRIRVEHFSYFKDLGPERVAGRNATEFTLQIKAGTELFFGFGRFIGRYDFSDPERSRLDPDEAYVEARLGRFKFRVGRMIETW
ncbi:MAG: hypothetical protein JRH20_32880, partial [Deltaproteobacteria bacterium]|nr:hypothetical protein [Deltaproteobacteria bacterium]